MRITLLSSLDGDTIAWEEQFGRREGRFVLCSDGTVVYRHPADDRRWLAGTDISQFRAAAEAWTRYNAAVESRPVSEQTAAVEQLREELARFQVLTPLPDLFWGILLEQAEAGML